MRKHRELQLALVLLLAFALRMIHIQSRPIWYDEAIAVLHASVSPAKLIQGTVTPVEGAGAANVHPLLYFLLLGGWIELVGRSPLAIRYLSVIFGMATVALLWRIASRYFDRRTNLAVALLAAVNPFHVAYSQETRMYALLALTSVTAAWGLLRALERPRLRWWALYIGAGALTLYTHNLGAFTLLGMNLLTLTRPRWRRRLPALTLADLVLLALYGPWLIAVLPGQIGFVGKGYWLTPPGAAEALRAPMLPILTYYEPPPSWLLGPGLFLGLLLLVLLTMRILRRPSRAGQFLFLGWTPPLALLLLSLWRPLYLERALLPSALFYVVAIGWFLVRGGLPRALQWALAALLAVTTLGSLVGHYTYVGFPRPPFQEAVAYLQRHLSPADAVVHTSKLTYLPMHYYAPDLPGEFLVSPQDTLTAPTQEALGIVAAPTITEAVGTADQVQLVYFARELKEVEILGDEHATYSRLIWLDQHFEEVKSQRFVDLVITLYRREVP